jgi:hypothetical protein
MLYLVLLVGALEWLGVSLELFQYHSLAYDKVLHFLAGCTCGIFGIFFLNIGGGTRYCDHIKANKRILSIALFSAFSIGIWWEILQAIIPILRDASDYDWHDSIGDMVFDTMGGIVTGLFYRTRA